jgi:uncharacterized membrane protein (UPF0136 family)
MDKLTEQRTPGSAHAAFTMAALTSAGGLMGFVQARSVPSVRLPIHVHVMHFNSHCLVSTKAVWSQRADPENRR